MNSKGFNDLAEKDFTNRFVGLDLILFVIVIKCTNSRAVCFQSSYVKKNLIPYFFLIPTIVAYQARVIQKLWNIVQRTYIESGMAIHWILVRRSWNFGPYVSKYIFSSAILPLILANLAIWPLLIHE